jgi:hypothetical protein
MVNHSVPSDALLPMLIETYTVRFPALNAFVHSTWSARVSLVKSKLKLASLALP